MRLHFSKSERCKRTRHHEPELTWRVSGSERLFLKDLTFAPL
ncbi:hypothetical protein SLEP1_g28590 [Rubroshorea leprosula]|uniref:Uncharacterized protein n=1 Tax=Rubroshorea leprosula TaxID=152421 RepID=A0AAV5K2T4_9ROSI|nr:hypothetical protein SLEP1_g28590 [Rubroshorea leprosula]